LAHFFNNLDDASSLAKHTATLDSIINDFNVLRFSIVIQLSSTYSTFQLAISIDHLAISADQLLLSKGTDQRIAEVQVVLFFLIA
jgi:hypothetical protein